MIRLRSWLLSACIALAGFASAASAASGDAGTMAAQIDRILTAGWTAARVQPAPLAQDEEFIRRVYLDLAGRIPAVAEVRQFLDDKRSDKRRRLIEQLLDGPRYVTHFTNVWRALLLPETTTNQQARFLAPGFEAWLRKKLLQNTRYDVLVRELLTTSVNGRNGNPFNQANGEPTSIGFYLAKETKPENVAAAASRLFLGVKIECAQCHNHPFADWKRQQFWGFAAFFAGLQRQRQANSAAASRELTIPGTERVVQAAFFDGKRPEWKTKTDARAVLAEWMTSKDNPYFARAAVNRLWAYFFGVGFIDPVDDMVGGEQKASHPELLDELARQFAVHDFDWKYLIRAITFSRAYQLSSQYAQKDEDNPHRFTHMPLRGLTPEQLFDSLAQATGYRENGLRGNVFLGNQGARGRFLARFANSSDKPTEVQTSILQALSLMNGPITTSATSFGRSETLDALLDAPFMDTAERVETLYLAALSRKPKAKELARMVQYAERGGSAELATATTEAQALADVFWILLNSSEFFLNH